ncbi:MAG: drug/metabolite exporter YedA [Longimicrobiales bacterium]|nr:drug/metabolite exporter YedA [Longimicrobiales bacterium]
MKASGFHIGLALATVYLVWGSTYLAIRFAVETLPPFLMAGTRFTIAGAILYGWRRSSHPRPSAAQWRAAAAVGALMLLVGNGGVTWAEQWVESGTAALMVASVPLWMVLLDWARPGGRPPRPAVWAGIAVGMAGVALLFGSPTLEPRYTMGWVVLLVASVAWAAGSLYSRTAVLPAPLLATGMQMLAGGALLLATGAATGELAAVDTATVSPRSVLALAYLIVFGSLVGYTSYVWLLRATPAALASTYAFVNPVVAVFLGWLLADERVTPRIVLASLVIVGGVALITLTRASRRGPPQPRPEPGTVPRRGS